MNDIEVLEEMLKDYKNRIEHEYGFSDYFIQKNKKEKQAIENLIKRVKQLEEIEEEHRKENGKLREELKEINEEYGAEQKHEMQNTIPKSKIKEKIEELEKFIESKRILPVDIIEDQNRNVKWKIEALQELLEE